MPIELSREELYERVWTEPIQKLSKEYGLSDVGLAKTCRRYNIPIPPRGYWAKKQAGHPHELKHDSELFEAYLAVEGRLRDQGADIERVVLEVDLRRDYQESRPTDPPHRAVGRGCAAAR